MRYYTLIAEWSHHILTVYVCISTAGSHPTTGPLIAIAEDQQSGCHQDKDTLPMELFHDDNRRVGQIPALPLWSHSSCQTTRPNCGAWATAATIHIRFPHCPQWPQIGNIDTSLPCKHCGSSLDGTWQPWGTLEASTHIDSCMAKGKSSSPSWDNRVLVPTQRQTLLQVGSRFEMTSIHQRYGDWKKLEQIQKLQNGHHHSTMTRSSCNNGIAVHRSSVPMTDIVNWQRLSSCHL
jgi:hypothetical protein